MAKHNLGLISVELGEIESDGALSTSLTPVGETVIGSATMTTADPTITDFNIEESDSPIESIVTAPGKVTFAWSTYNIEPAEMVRFFGGTIEAPDSDGGVATVGVITPGTLYTTGVYEDVSFTGGTGTGFTGIVTVAGGGVTSVVLTTAGSGYTVGNDLTTAAANIGGTGSGFSFDVSAITAANGGTWAAPDTFVENELSVVLTDKKGNIFQIPRAKLSSKMSISFSKSKLGQIDVTATVLQPALEGLARIKFIYV